MCMNVYIYLYVRMNVYIYELDFYLFMHVSPLKDFEVQKTKSRCAFSESLLIFCHRLASYVTKLSRSHG